MAKKNRTGLQSEISHIFAGVPIPKKRRPQGPEQKSETKDEDQQTPIEQLTPDQLPAEKQTPPEQPSEAEISAEQSQYPQSKIEQPATDETSIEHLMAPESADEEPEAEFQAVSDEAPEEPTIKEPRAEKIQDIQPPAELPVLEQPPVTEPSVEQSPVPFGDTLEVPELEEPAGAVQKPSSVVPLKTRTLKESPSAAYRKGAARPKDKRLVPKTAASSRRQKTMVILVIALSILLVVLLVKPFQQTSRTTGPENIGLANAANKANPNAGRININWTKPEPYPADIRDPMKESSLPLLNIETGLPIITGISTGDEGKYAILSNGAIVQEGDEIFGGKVIKINPNSILFEKDGEIHELKWQEKNQ
jgi:hypothetical protein